MALVKVSNPSCRESSPSLILLEPEHFGQDIGRWGYDDCTSHFALRTSHFALRTSHFARRLLFAFTLTAAASCAMAQAPLTTAIPRTEAEIYASYPDATKVVEGVYRVQRGDHARTFMFGLGGMKYRLGYLKNLRKEASRSANLMPKDIAIFDSRIERLQAAITSIEHRHTVSNRAKAPTELNSEPYCGHLVNIVVGYYDGFSAAQAFAGIHAEPDGAGPHWEGTFHLSAEAYRVGGGVTLFDHEETTVQAGGYADAGVVDYFGGVSACTMSAAASVEAVPNGNGMYCQNGWMDEGPCL